MLQSMALHPVSQFFLGTRIPASDFPLPSSSSLQLRKTRVWPRKELDTIEAHSNVLVSESQEPQDLEPTTKYNGTSQDRLLGQEWDSPASSNRRGYESEENGDRRFYQSEAPRVKRDVWVKPGGALVTGLKTDAERRLAEIKDTAEKYLWVNPNRKNKTGAGTWPERRVGIELLHSTINVAAALREWVISLPVMT